MVGGIDIEKLLFRIRRVERSNLPFPNAAIPKVRSMDLKFPWDNLKGSPG